MNQKTILIGAGVILVLIAAIFYSTGFFTSAENEFELPCDDENLEITARIDLTLNFLDGESKTITGTTGAPLSVEYNGNEVSSVSWEMKAMANTPAGAEPYDSVELTLNPSSIGFTETDFYLTSSVEYDTGDGQWRTHWTEVTEDNPYTYSIPVDTGTYTALYSHSIVFDTVFSDGDNANYDYRVHLSPGGYGCYRGVSDSSPGEWDTVSLGSQSMACTYPIDYIDNQATVDWVATVDWN